MKINTVKLQSLINKSLKGAGLNKLIPITSFVGINYYKHPAFAGMILELKTTNGTNYLNLYNELEEVGEELHVVVEIEPLSKLVSKITTEFVELSVNNDKSTFHIKGNGDYDIPLQFDESGNEINFPDPSKNESFESCGELKLSTVLDSLNYCKSSLAVTLEEPVYTNYYVGKEVVATDVSKICKLNKSVFNDPKLINPSMMELLGIVEEESIDVMISTSVKYISFSTPTVTITGSLQEGIDDYQIVAIDGLLEQEYKYSCEVSKEVLFNALDRVSLFIDKYDNDGVKLTFEDGKLFVENLKTTGVEVINLKSYKADEKFTCIAPNSSLMDFLKSVHQEFVEIQFGEDNAIKLIHDDVVQVLALLQE